MRERAAGYDRDNAFFTEDLAELREAGYLTALVPAEFGGLGWGFDDAVRAQMRLAGAAPATALAVNMHLVWTGVAKILRDRGDDTPRLRPPRGRRRGGLRLRHQRGRQRPHALRLAHDRRAAGRRRLPLLGSQDLHVALAGVDPARHDGPRHGLGRCPEDRLRVHRPRGPRHPHPRRLGHDRHAGDARAARPCSTARSPPPTASCDGSTPARTRTRSSSASSRASNCCSPRSTPASAHARSTSPSRPRTDAPR